MKSIANLGLAIVLLLTPAAAVRAQITTGSVTGTVKDMQGGVIPGATVTLISDTRGVVVGSNSLPTRLGGGGESNFMMDGVSAMDDGSNRLLIQMNVESIAEVKVLTSTYQAEYGRSSGIQVTAVTKSGTNRFRGSVYDVERNSRWYSNSKVNKLNGDPKTVLKERDWGYSIGGPAGKPGGNN